MTAWHVLRIYAGNPLKIAQAIEDLGGEAYFPKEKVLRHRSRRGPKPVPVSHTRSLMPGWIFAREDRPFDFERIPAVILERQRARCEQLRAEGAPKTLRRPRTAAVRVRLLVSGESPITVSDGEIESMRVIEANPRDQGALAMMATMAEALEKIATVRAKSLRKRGRPVFAAFGELVEALS